MTRSIDFRYVIVRNGADLCEIYPADGGAAIRMNDSAEIKTSLRGAFFPDERVNWLADRIRPEMILDGVTYSLGIFLPATVVETKTAETRAVEIEAYDQCWLAKDFARPLQSMVAKNENYVAVIKNFLHLAGIDQTLATANAAKLPEARHWEIGTPFLSIINELLSRNRRRPRRTSATRSAARTSGLCCCRRSPGRRTSTRRRMCLSASAPILTRATTWRRPRQTTTSTLRFPCRGAAGASRRL